jgi:putative phosphoribosyl transferase
VLAVPVAPPDALRMFADEVDTVVCVRRPTFLGAVGAFYLDFAQVGDASVTRMLDEAHGFVRGAAGGA